MTGFVTLRAASRDDAADLAILADIAAHGLTSWLWLKDAAREGLDTPMECGRLRMRRDAALGGWQNATVAQAYGEVAGASIGYRLDGRRLEETVVEHAALMPVMELQKKAAESWFIASLGVYCHMRGIGIGGILLDDQIERAGRMPTSLITASDNEGALRLYGRKGFCERARSDALPLFETSKKFAWILLTRTVEGQRQKTHG